MKVALTIAGSDSSGGAGIQADLKTFHQHGVYGTSVVTAVTAQDSHGVLASEPVSTALVARQLEAVARDFPPQATKTGMLATQEIVTAVAERLAEYALRSYVLDPVLQATSGAWLLEPGAAAAIIERLVPLASLVTPNIPEAQTLTRVEIHGPDDMVQAGKALVRCGARAALVTGGHLEGDEVIDVLVSAGATQRFSHPRIHTTSTHGTGCTLSAAITAGLALDKGLERAVEDAIGYVTRALEMAPGLGPKGGRGPLNHFV